MRPIIQEIDSETTPEGLVENLRGLRGVVLLRSHAHDSDQARYSFVAAEPFLTVRSFGSRCEIRSASGIQRQFGNPWAVLDTLMARYEILDEVDLPFPLGGCFGFWGYDLKNFVEPRLSRRAVDDLELPDCCVGFHDSLVVFDHQLHKTWIVSTGLAADGSRDRRRATEAVQSWINRLVSEDPDSSRREEALDRMSTQGVSGPEWKFPERGCVGDQPQQRWRQPRPGISSGACGSEAAATGAEDGTQPRSVGDFSLAEAPAEPGSPQEPLTSNLSREEFIARVERAQRYIRSGDIYQVNLSQRLSTPWSSGGWDLYRRLADISPAPFSAWLDCGDFQIASSSPERFLKLSGPHIETRPIKGTRPRSNDPDEDARLAFELQTSEKERAELVMITDLLRNDLGRVCEFGSVRVPDLLRLERFAQVQHLVSTVEGRLRPDVTHFNAFASCFPGGSITGAPKIRAMEIIDELEPVTRGPYTGGIGYLGFNRESQLNIAIRTAVCADTTAWFHVGAGIVADSDPAAEYDETLAKAAGFLAALEHPTAISKQPLRSADSNTSGR